jgi:hypothetical protein
MEWRSSVDEEWKTKFKTKIVVFYSYSQPFLKISSLPACGVFISRTVFADQQSTTAETHALAPGLANCW